jgi:hypothetical protein
VRWRRADFQFGTENPIMGPRAVPYQHIFHVVLRFVFRVETPESEWKESMPPLAELNSEIPANLLLEERA